MSLFNLIIILLETFLSIFFIFYITNSFSKKQVIPFICCWMGDVSISFLYNKHLLNDYTLLIVELIYYFFIAYFLTRKDYLICFFISAIDNLLLMFSNSIVIVILKLFTFSYFTISAPIISKLFYLSVIYLFCKYLSHYIFELKIRYTFDIIILLLLILYVIIFNMIFVGETLIIESLIELIILNIFVYFIYKFFKLNLQFQEDDFTNKLIIQELKEQEKNYKNLIQNEQKIRTMKHDIKHHLLYLLDCYKDDTIDFEEEIKKEIQHLNQIDSSIDTGIPTLNYIISSKKDILKEQHIQFLCNHYPHELIFNKLDSYIILGNLIDNAIENCCENPTKKIFIDFKDDHDYTYIKIKNTINYPVLKFNPKLNSTKNMIHHGIGLKSVQSTLNKYNGSLLFNEDKYWFYTTIIIPKKIELEL